MQFPSRLRQLRYVSLKCPIWKDRSVPTHSSTGLRPAFSRTRSIVQSPDTSLDHSRNTERRILNRSCVGETLYACLPLLRRRRPLHHAHAHSQVLVQGAYGTKPQSDWTLEREITSLCRCRRHARRDASVGNSLSLPQASHSSLLWARKRRRARGLDDRRRGERERERERVSRVALASRRQLRARLGLCVVCSDVLSASPRAYVCVI